MVNWKESAHVWILTQAVSSIALTLLNKSVSMALPYPFFVLAVQNFSSILLFTLFNYLQILPMNPITLKQVVYFLPTTLTFVLILWTSLEGLRLVSVSFVIIARNFVPLITATIETVFFGSKLSLDGYLSLILVFLGSVIYGYSDVTLTYEGMFWLGVNLLCVVFTPIIEKRLLTNVNAEQTPTGVTFMRNMLSIPMLLFLALQRNTVSELFGIFGKIDSTIFLNLCGSSTFGFSIGVAYFFLLNLVSTTSMAIANTFYKLLTLVGSLILWSVPFGVDGLIGIVLSFIGITWYTLQQQAQKGGNKPELPSSVDHNSKGAPSAEEKRKSMFRVTVIGFALICTLYVLYIKSSAKQQQ